MNSQELSVEEAAQRLLRRRTIRRNFIEWCRHCGYEPAPHYRLIIDRLEKVARGEILRLAIFMPPGSAKSTYASVLFPPWLLANEPGASVLAASHTVELAEKWGRRVRNLAVEFPGTLGIQLVSDIQAAGRWALQSGGEYFAAGVGVGIGITANGVARPRIHLASFALRQRIDVHRCGMLELLGHWVTPVGG